MAAVEVPLAHHEAAQARVVLYAGLADLLTYPEPEVVDQVRSGDLPALLLEAARSLPYPLEVGPLELPAEDDVGPEYIRLFDLPARGTPCPLYGGALGGDRQATMEDLLRFYRHFGLSVAHAEQRDLPDFVPTVLEFLGYLVMSEAEAPGNGEDPLAYRRAQRDVLERHLGKWAPVIRARVAKLDPPPIYGAATALLDEFTAAELRVL